MAEQLHPTAAHHLPTFITAPGDTDVLMVATAVILGLSVFGFGILFLRLHTLPERVAHKAHKIQFEIVAILGLLALFTHMHIFWVAGLLLAFIDLSSDPIKWPPCADPDRSENPATGRRAKERLTHQGRLQKARYRRGFFGDCKMGEAEIA